MNVALVSSSAVQTRLRVMIVDDAVVVRGLFSRWVAAERDLEVVASLSSGLDALREFGRVNPDVVVLDIDMPGLDGIAALPKLLEKRRGLVVIIASTLTRRNAEISLRALAMGAADYIPKPLVHGDSRDFRRELIEKIRQLGSRAKSLRLGGPSAVRPNSSFALRPMPFARPAVLLVGASTGGPQALEAVLKRMPDVLACAPVLITQHMPPTFTAILAEHLGRVVNAPVNEGKDGEPVLAGHVYLARGGTTCGWYGGTAWPC